MLSKLDKLKSKLQGKESKVTIATEFYVLAKELGCLPDLLGRDYEVKDPNGKIVFTIRQKPISLPTFITLLEEMSNDYKRRKKQMEQNNRRRR